MKCIPRKKDHFPINAMNCVELQVASDTLKYLCSIWAILNWEIEEFERAFKYSIIRPRNHIIWIFEIEIPPKLLRIRSYRMNLERFYEITC
jgi:hypothetical protein